MTEKPCDMSEREQELWHRCIATVLAEEAGAQERRAKQERAQTVALLARAREILREGRRVPAAPVGAGVLGAQVAQGLAWLAANVDAGVHVSIDWRARQAFEVALLEHERSHPEASDVGWWHALDGHGFDLDSPDGACACGALCGGFLTLAELHRRARAKYEAAARGPAGRGSRWDGAL